MNPTVGEQPYNEKIYGVLKGAYGDKFTHTPESFLEKISTDKEYQTKIYGVLKQAYGDKFTHTPESFVQKIAVKKKEQSGFLGKMQEGVESALQQPSEPQSQPSNKVTESDVEQFQESYGTSKLKNFEKRFNQPEKSIKNEDGTVSTHKMMSANVDGKEIALPTIVEVDGKLKELSINEAIDHAMKTGEYKEFKTQQEAQAYAEGGYKKGTKLDPKNKVTESDLSRFKEDYGAQESKVLPVKAPSTEEVDVTIQTMADVRRQMDAFEVGSPERTELETKYDDLGKTLEQKTAQRDYANSKDVVEFYRNNEQQVSRKEDDVNEAFTGVIPPTGKAYIESLSPPKLSQDVTKEQALEIRQDFEKSKDKAVALAESDYAKYLRNKGEEAQVKKWEALTKKKEDGEEWNNEQQDFMRSFRKQALNAINMVQKAEMFEIGTVADVDAYTTGASALAVEAENLNKEFQALGIKEGQPVDVATRKKAELLVQKSEELNAKMSALKEQTGFTDELQDRYVSAVEGMATIRTDLDPDFRGLREAEFFRERLSKQATTDAVLNSQSGTGIAKEFGKGVSTTIYKGLVGLGELTKTVWDVTGDTDYGWTDELYDGIEGHFKDFDSAFTPTQGAEVPDAYYYSRLIGDAVGSIALFAAGGAVAKAAKLPAFVGTFTSSFLITQDDYYREARQAGLNEQQSAAVGLTLAAITGSLEGIAPDIGYLATAPFRRSIINAFMSGKPMSAAFREAIKAVPASSLALLKAGTKEGFLEEGLQTLAEDITKTIVNDTLDVEMETFNPKTYRDSIIAGFAAGGGMSVLSRPKPKSPVTEQILMDAVRNPEQTIAYVPAEQQEQVKTQLYEAAKTLSVLEKHPNWSKLTPAQQNHVLSELQRKGQLEETAKVTGKDEAIMSEIGAIDAEVQQIMSGKAVEQEKIEAVPDTPSPVIELEPIVTSETVAEEGDVRQSNSDLQARNKETEAKIKNKGLFLAEYDANGNKIGESVGEIISQSNTAPIATSVRDKNGFEFVEFSNPETGQVDVIVTGDTKGNYVGFYRLYENGKPTNKWSSKMNSKDKKAFKIMMSGVQEMLPQGHEYSEKTSISTDGLRVWNQQLQRGYELQYDSKGNLITNTVAINGDALVNELGIDVSQGNFDNISVTNNEDFNKVKKALLPYLQKFGLSESNIRNVNGTVEIDLPLLKKKAVEQSTAHTPAVSETVAVATEEVIEVKAPEIIVEETVEPTPKKKKVTAATRTNTRVVDDKIVENTEPASTQTEAVEAVGNEVAEVEEIKTETEEVAPVPADLASDEVVAPKADSVVWGGVEVGAKPKPIDEQSIAASQKWVKDLYSLPDLTRVQDKSGNVYDVKDSKIRKLTLDKEGNVIDAEIIHTDRDVHKRGAYSNPDFFNEGYRILPEQSLNETSQSVGTPSEVKPEQPKSLPQSWREKAARIKGGSGNTLMIAPKVYAFALELAADVYEAAVKAGKSIDEAIKASRDAIRKYLASDDEFKNLSDEDKTDTLNAISDDLGEAIDTDFERKEGKKSLLNRAATGTESERIKNAVIAFGLDYEIETQAAAEKAAKGFIDKVGLDEAVEAVRRGYVNGAMAAFVWAKAIDMVSDQISEAKNDAEIAALEDIQRSLLDEFDRQTRDNARFISALGRIYENSNFGYNLSSMVRRYKAANGGVIDAETEARFKEYERQIKELNDKIKEAEKRVQEAEERAAAQAIVDSVENDKRNPNRYAQKAKKAANKFREFKKKPFELKDANGNPIQINTMGIAWNDLIEIGAKAIELSGRIADGISAITAYLGNEDWYKNLSVEDKKAVDAQINEYFYETNEDGSIPNSVIRDIVASGVTELDALIEKLGAIFPSLTERQIRDQISGYGKEVSMSRDEITADVNRLKRAARIISKIEDLRKGVKPSTSTRKRAEADQKEKQLLKDLRAAMQDFDWSAERLDQAKTNAKKAIDEYERRIRDNDFSTKKKQKVKPDTELRDLQTKRQEVKSKYDTELHRAEIKNRSLRQRVIDGLLEIWNLTRAIMATAEMSFVNVQGGLYSLTQPMKLARAFKKAVEHFWSEKKAEQWGAFVKSQPYFQEMQDSKLALSEYDAKLTAREEQFMGGWINQLFDWFGYAEKTKFGRAWMKLNFPKRLERAGVAYLNTMRILRWLDGKQMLEMKGKPFDESTVDDYKMMADVVNTLSGRASLGKLENQTKGLAFIFFSPRLWASVIKTASPYALYHFGKMTTKDGKPSIAQQMVLTDLLKFYTLTGAIVAMAAAHYNDDDDEETGVELDPRSSDFMKIKTGPSTRIDPWGGRQQEIVFWFRLYFGEIKNTNTGEVNKLGETPFITNNLLTLALRRIETKLSPSAGIVSKFMQSTVNKEGEREDRFGKPYSFTDEVDNLYPMYWGTLHEIWKENPKLVASFLSTYAFFGGGVQVYGDKGQGKLDQFGQPFTGKDHIKNSLFYQLYENADIPNDFSNIDKILGKDQPKISPEMQREIKDKMFYYWRDEITSNAEDLREMPLEDRVKEMDDLRTNVRTAIREYVRNVYEEGKPIDWSKLESN